MIYVISNIFFFRYRVFSSIIARLLVVFESKSVSKNANTSLELHWNSPYSLEANKIKTKLLDKGTKSNSKYATSVMGMFCPVLLLIFLIQSQIVV
jgi:hypothetical protein